MGFNSKMSNQASCLFFLRGVISQTETNSQVHAFCRKDSSVSTDSQLVVANFYCEVYSIGEENVIPLHNASWWNSGPASFWITLCSSLIGNWRLKREGLNSLRVTCLEWKNFLKNSYSWHSSLWLQNKASVLHKQKTHDMKRKKLLTRVFTYKCLKV